MKITKSMAAQIFAVMVISMVTASQIRAGRALLGWTQQMLADRALVAVNTVRAIENDTYAARIESVEAIRKALIGEGIIFISADVMGEGVRLSQPEKTRR